MKKLGKKDLASLGARERQILDVVVTLGEASVSDILERLPNPPSYSSVRTMVRLLETKGFLKHRSEGVKYIYQPTFSKESATKKAVSHLLNTFFGGSASNAMAALLEQAELTDEELKGMEAMIAKARKEGR